MAAAAELCMCIRCELKHLCEIFFRLIEGKKTIMMLNINMDHLLLLVVVFLLCVKFECVFLGGIHWKLLNVRRFTGKTIHWRHDFTCTVQSTHCGESVIFQFYYEPFSSILCVCTQTNTLTHIIIFKKERERERKWKRYASWYGLSLNFEIFQTDNI